MEFEEEKADGGQAYDYLFAAHQSIMCQNQSKMFASDPFASNLSEGWKGEDNFAPFCV